MPECGSQIVLCDLPVRFDTYEGCTHNCAYCFSRKKQLIGGAVEVHETEVTLRRFIEGVRKPETNWIDWDLPLHWGGMSDPFQPYEEKAQVSLRCLEVFAETQYPVVFSTKGRLAGTEPYTRLMAQSNIAAQVSMVSPRYDRFETGAPTFAERLEMLPRLAAASRRLIVRVQPYIPGYYQDVIDHLQAFKDAGVHGLIVEALKRFRKFDGGLKLGGDYVYPVEVLRADFERIREACYQVGLKFYSGENRLRAMGDSPTCCGVGDLPGWKANQANMNYLNRPGGIQYTERMQQPGSGGPFRTLCQATLEGGIVGTNSYQANMEAACRTRTFLQIMGYLPEDKD